MRSRFSSPATVTSKRGMLRLLVGLQHDYTRQVAGLVRIEALLERGGEPQQLAGNDIRCQACVLRNIEAQLHQQVGVRALPFTGCVGYNQRGSSQLLHFFQNVQLSLAPALRKQKTDQHLRAKNRLGSMAELQGMERLGVGAGHVGYLERRFAGQAVEGPLAEVNVVGELVGADKLKDAVVQGHRQRLRQGRHSAQRLLETMVARHAGGQRFRGQQHGTERAGHHRALLVGSRQLNRVAGSLFQRLATAAGDCQGTDVARSFQVFGRAQHFCCSSGAGDQDWHQVRGAGQQRVRKQQQFRCRYSPGPQSGYGRPGGSRRLRQIKTGAAAYKETLGAAGKTFAEVAQLAAFLEAGQALRPGRSEEHTSELQSHVNLVCRLLLEKKKNIKKKVYVSKRSKPSFYLTRQSRHILYYSNSTF